MKHTVSALCVTTMLIALVGSSLGQVSTGTPPWASLGGGPFDVVNLGNLNAHFGILVRQKAGRVTPFIYEIGYDSSFWIPVTINGTKTWQPNAYGWTFPGPGGQVTRQVITTYQRPCNPPRDNRPVTVTVYGYYVYHDVAGGLHPFNTAFTSYSDQGAYGCPFESGGSGSTATAADGSSYALTIASWTGAMTVTAPDGNTLVSPTWPNTKTDAYGNQIKLDGSGNYTDTLGTTALSVTGTNPKYLRYTAPSGSLATWTVSYTSYNIKTNFGCTTVSNYNASNVLLPSQIQLPDGTSYSFTYENTQGYSGYKTGRLTSVTLPTGGSITYAYPLTNNGTTNGINCADGSAPVASTGNSSMTRTVSPGGTWSYYRTQVSGNHWQTKVTSPPDPLNQGSVGNDTVIDFQQDGATGQSATFNFLETQRQVWQGASAGGTLLSTRITCYNAPSGQQPTPGSCPTNSVSTPISRVSVFSYLPDTSSTSMWAETDTWYYLNNPAYPTDVNAYDYRKGVVGPQVRLVRNAYTVVGNTIVLGITGVSDGSLNWVAQTLFSYNETAATQSVGTPQHVSPTATAPYLTSVWQRTALTHYLERKLTYYDTGMLKTATDLGLDQYGTNLTTYSYDNTGNPSPSCGNSFVTSVSAPLTLSRYFTWDCNGGVQTSVKDENQQISATYYAQTSSYGSPDPKFWRPYASVDQLNNVTSLSYESNTVSESTLLFNNSNSVVDQRVKLDAFGRIVLNQTKQGPAPSAQYDSTQTDYDIFGRVAKTYLPFINAADASCSGACPAVTTSYDALNRPRVVTDGGNGTVAYTYTNNDVYQEIGPKPSGDNNTKRKQLEYDAIGRLRSICEITNATGSGTCGQANARTGYWTVYTYDAAGRVTGVTQNAQASTGQQQTRSYTYDTMGRVLTEQNPETGTITYRYDSWDSACGSYTSAGDLVEKKDAVGNVTCMKYDVLHRVVQITYPSGSYASVTPTKCFVYDSATVNSNVMANAKGRLAEAYTTAAASCPGTATVDEGFSYSARGEIADVWEKTPNSAGYYHVNATYWAHGRLNVLNGGASPLPGLPTITYGASDGSGLDGKGRITKVSASSGQNPASAISWNAGNQVTAVTLGSSDSDAYQYDPNTGRMTQYKFNMGTGPQSQTGVLTWNANGTLGQMQITDQINTANTQTCTYTHDDLTRIASANCGSVWAQTFGFDPFGNLTKTGSANFQPTYTGTPSVPGSGSPTNQYYNLLGGPNGTSNYYDGNGNLISDGVGGTAHTYTWDADGNMLSTDGSSVTMIYDAMDRMVEQTRGSSHTEIVYGPYGLKLALMNGQNLVNAFVKIPGGSRAVYDGSGLAYYRHSDHLGSSRLATTPSRTKYYDVAYAPYGEDYNRSGTSDLSFTDEHQDTVNGGWTTNLYDFMLREYRTAHGRWTSPDPVGLGAVDPTNPQSWNRYAYVLNNPLAMIDLLGDDGCYTTAGSWLNDKGSIGSCFSGPESYGNYWVSDETGLVTFYSGAIPGGCPTYGCDSAPPVNQAQYCTTGGSANCTQLPTVPTNGPICPSNANCAGSYQGSPNLVADSMRRYVIAGLKEVAKTAACGKSGKGAFLSTVRNGAIKGAIVGSIVGSGALGAPTGGLGAGPGAVIGGVAGAADGAADAALTGLARAVICTMAGAY